MNCEELIVKALGNEDQALSFEQKMLIKKISKMDNLPIPNANIMKVMLLLRHENVQMRELIEHIEKDQSLVAKILQLVNSGFYGLRNAVDSVERAVGLLGIINIKHVVYSATIMDMFTDDEQIEWNHSYSTSVLMQKLMKANEIPAASNLPMTMLMHDLGKVVLRKFNPTKYKIALATSRNERKPIHVKEDDILQFTHALAAGILLEKWQMTEDIIVPIVYHHSDTELPEDYIVETAMVQFVDYVDCMARNIPCKELSKELLEAAGFEDLNLHYWINYQQALILDLEGSEEEEDGTDRANRIIESNHYYNCTEIPEVEFETTPTSPGASSRILKPKRPAERPAGKALNKEEEEISFADTHVVDLNELEEDAKRKIDIESGKTATDRIRKISRETEHTSTSVIHNKDKTKTINLPIKDEDDDRMFWEVIWEKIVNFLKFLIS